VKAFIKASSIFKVLPYRTILSDRKPSYSKDFAINVPYCFYFLIKANTIESFSQKIGGCDLYLNREGL
jgi:hypothetical protein